MDTEPQQHLKLAVSRVHKSVAGGIQVKADQYIPIGTQTNTGDRLGVDI